MATTTDQLYFTLYKDTDANNYSWFMYSNDSQWNRAPTDGINRLPMESGKDYWLMLSRNSNQGRMAFRFKGSKELEDKLERDQLTLSEVSMMIDGRGKDTELKWKERGIIAEVYHSIDHEPCWLSEPAAER